jgi:hypothetical protein
MANYLCFGHSAYEIEVQNQIKRRVFFAITVRDNPAWLSWYFYSQGAGDGLIFASATTADSTRKIGDMIPDMAGQHFAFDKQINVNAFADTNKQGQMTSSPASCTLKTNKTTGTISSYLDCAVVITNKSGLPRLHFVLSDAGTMRGMAVENAPGVVDYVGTVDLKKTSIKAALGLGPVLISKWLKDPLRPDY